MDLDLCSTASRRGSMLSCRVQALAQLTWTPRTALLAGLKTPLMHMLDLFNGHKQQIPQDCAHLLFTQARLIRLSARVAPSLIPYCSSDSAVAGPK